MSATLPTIECDPITCVCLFVCLQGFLLEKKVGVNQPKRLENAKILIANTSMDTDKIKVFGAKVRVDSAAKIADLELAEKV